MWTHLKCVHNILRCVMCFCFSSPFSFWNVSFQHNVFKPIPALWHQLSHFKLCQILLILFVKTYGFFVIFLGVSCARSLCTGGSFGSRLHWKHAHYRRQQSIVESVCKYRYKIGRNHLQQLHGIALRKFLQPYTIHIITHVGRTIKIVLLNSVLVVISILHFAQSRHICF